ncbi:MAG: L,D-transpeptidase [Solirubrobacteraceae bacterium]
MTTRRTLIAAVLTVMLVAGAATRMLDDGGPSRGAAPSVPQAPRTQPEPPVPAGPLAARVLRRTQLRRSPGGRVVRTITTTTEFESPHVLAVVARDGAWLGVLSDLVPNARVAWIPVTSAELVPMPYSLDVDLSARRVLVRREGRVVRRVKIAVGTPATPTPTGRFAVTDALRIGKGSGSYGCCALALTARQGSLPQGWGGGDRIAIHGTTLLGTIGTPASFGCMRARNEDMRWLLRRISPGVQVHVRA